MAVLVIADVPGQTQQGYDSMLAVLAPMLRNAPGFVLHGAHPVQGGWRVVEVWESREQANTFYAKVVAPNLPPGIRPKRSVQEMHACVRA